MSPQVLFCHNSRVVTPSKEPRNHRKGKHIKRKYHLICEIIVKEDVVVEKITSMENLVDPFTKTLSIRIFDGHRDNLGIKCVSSMLQDQWEIVRIKPQKTKYNVTNRNSFINLFIYVSWFPYFIPFALIGYLSIHVSYHLHYT